MANQYLPGVIQIPSALLITGITNSFPMVVTFTVPPMGLNTYVPGQLVNLKIPKTWGMFQADGLSARIYSVGVSTMALSVDSTLFDIFIDGSGSRETPASLSPAGSQNLEFNNTTNQVGFQSANNRGN